MITIYFHTESGIKSETLTPQNHHLLEHTVWIDLISPTKEEEKALEQELNLEIPTKDEINEIEPSSRLYSEHNILYMTATMVAMSNLPEVKTDVVSFILTEKKLITLRYGEFHAFKLFSTKILKSKMKDYDASAILIELLDETTNRLADILEKISHTYDEMSQLIFRPSTTKTKENDYKKILQNIGANGDLGTKASESLVSLTRLISFLEQSNTHQLSKESALLLNIVNKDIIALRDHANFLFNKCNLLLNATFGMISIEQNNIIKIFSVAAVMFLPPTLIASIYGMNFDYMPELHRHLGYPLAVILMFISAWLPFKYFKKRGWL